MVVRRADQELIVGERLDDANEEQDIAVRDDVKVEEVFLCEEAGFRAVLPDFFVERIFEDQELGGIIRQRVARHGGGIARRQLERLIGLGGLMVVGSGLECQRYW